MPRRLVLAGMLFLAGCGGAVPETAPERVGFEATDGRHLHGRLTTAGEDAPAVVLVHGLYGEPAQWDAFADDLQEAGFTTLAYASRSDHEPDPAVLARDVIGAVRFLGAAETWLVGSSVGGETVAYVIGTRPDLDVAGAVAISPVRSPRIDALRRHGAFRPRDLLVVSDQREAGTARRIVTEGVELFTTETPGHGVELLADPVVGRRAIDWLTLPAR